MLGEDAFALVFGQSLASEFEPAAAPEWENKEQKDG